MNFVTEFSYIVSRLAGGREAESWVVTIKGYLDRGATLTEIARVIHTAGNGGARTDLEFGYMKTSAAADAAKFVNGVLHAIRYLNHPQEIVQGWEDQCRVESGVE